MGGWFTCLCPPIRGYSPGGRVNKFYSHGSRGNSHFDYYMQNIFLFFNRFVYLKISILSVIEKLPLLKFRYFENYKRNLDSYFNFVFLVNYRHAQSNKSVLLTLQLRSSCCTCILCFWRFIKTWTHYIFKNQTCHCMPEIYSVKTPSKCFRLFHQIEQARLRPSRTTITWQVPIELNGNIWCSLVKDIVHSCVTNAVFCSTDS